MLVASPVERIRHFIGGLKPKICKDVSSIDLLTFEDNVKKYFWFEEIANQIKVDKGAPSGYKRLHPETS